MLILHYKFCLHLKIVSAHSATTTMSFHKCKFMLFCLPTVFFGFVLFFEATRWGDGNALEFTQECARWKINTLFTVFTVVASLQQITVYMQPNEVMYHNSTDNIQLRNVAPKQRKDLSHCSSLTASRRHAGRNVHRNIYLFTCTSRPEEAELVSFVSLTHNM